MCILQTSDGSLRWVLVRRHQCFGCSGRCLCHCPCCRPNPHRPRRRPGSHHDPRTDVGSGVQVLSIVSLQSPSVVPGSSFSSVLPVSSWWSRRSHPQFNRHAHEVRIGTSRTDRTPVPDGSLGVFRLAHTTDVIISSDRPHNTFVVFPVIPLERKVRISHFRRRHPDLDFYYYYCLISDVFTYPTLSQRVQSRLQVYLSILRSPSMSCILRFNLLGGNVLQYTSIVVLFTSIHLDF